MIPFRLLSFKTVAERLERAGCRHVRRLRSASIWRTAWGFEFGMPEVDAAKSCPEDDFERILRATMSTRPYGMVRHDVEDDTDGRE